jgi:ABC-type dipeptide/oligopeptide/nickel transport system ATPase component
MALCAKPKLLIADEPSTSLDVTTQAKLLQLFVRLKEKHGLSILIISHDIGVIQEVSSRIYVMHRGSVVETGSSTSVLSVPKHPYTASLLDSFSRFGEKIPIPPTDPEAGVGCAYRGICAAYRGRLTPDERIACETYKPKAQIESSLSPEMNAASLAGEAWSKCLYPTHTKAHSPGTASQA